MSKKSETAKAVDTVSAEEIGTTSEDPTVGHHLTALQELAASEGKEQRKVIAASEIEGVKTERVLIVKPNGSYTVKESTK